MSKLYIILRTDMASMNTVGRASSMASHITSAFDHNLKGLDRIIKNDPSNSYANQVKIRSNDWKEQTPYGFGTVCVLDGGSADDIKKLENGLDMSKYFSGAVEDPEYHLEDGDFIHKIPNVLAGMFVFPITDDTSELDHLPLR